MVIEIDYRDPVVQRMLAVSEAANASHAESMDRISAEHAKAMSAGLKEHEEKIKQAESAYAAGRPQQPEDPHRWPDRARRSQVLSLAPDEERSAPPPTPPPVRRPEAAKPKTPERPRHDHVLSFGDDEDEDGFQGFGRR